MNKKTNKSWRGRAAVLAITAALGGSALLGAAAPVTAWAAGASPSVTIVPAENNGTPQYQAYRLFTAQIDDENNNAQKIAWDASVSDDAQGKIITKLDDLTGDAYTEWATSKGGTTLPQNVLEFMSVRIAGSGHTTDVHDQSVVNAETFAMDFAAWLSSAESGVQPVGAATANQVFEDTEGYYLFVTKTKTGKVATSPIWFPLGGSANKVFEKAGVPTVDKTLESQNAGSGQIGENLPFKVTATLPGNYNSYGTFKVVLKDTPTNLKIAAEGVKVMSGTKDITNAAGVTVDVAGGKLLTVTIDNLKVADPAATANTKLVVTYNAQLTANADHKPGANTNEVVYEFSSNPGVSSETSTATDTSVPVYSFLLNLVKKDKHTDVALNGAKFIIKNGDDKCYDKDSKSWTLSETDAKAEGKLLATENGTLSVMGLDAGTFTLTEVVAPDGYELPANPDITLVVTPEYSAAGEMTSLAVKADGVIVSTKDVATADKAAGTLSVTAVNDKNVALAMTGAEGVGMAGAGVVALGLVWYAVRSRRDRANQQ